MLKTFAVIGDPIDHSLSPIIHNAGYRELEIECTYIGYRVAQGELATGIESLKKIKISGFNVTIPHKVDMMKYIDDVDDNCKKIGAVNTVLNDDGILRGFNTCGQIPLNHSICDVCTFNLQFSICCIMYCWRQ